MTSPLVIALPLYEGETPSGYVSRLASIHRTTTRDFCSDLGLDWPSLCSGRVDQLERLAWLTGHDLRRLKLWSATQISANRYRVGKTTSSSVVFRRTACRCCPICVSEGRDRDGVHGIFELLEWKVLSLHRCEHHGVRLITLPAAAHSHEAYDFTSQVVLHWELIKECAASRSILPETSFEKYVRARLRNGPLADWLAGLDLTILQGACQSLGAALSSDEVANEGCLQEEGIRKLSELGYSYLRNGPSGLIDALIRLKESGFRERPYFSSDLGPFYRWISAVSDHGPLAAMVETTREHIFEQYPVPRDKTVLGQKPTQEIWLTMEEARKRSGFGAIFLKKLLGHINGLNEEDALRRTDVKVSELATVQTFWQKLMNLSDTAKALGLRADHIKALMRSGVLKQVRITSTLRYAQRDEIDAILRRIEELPTEAGAGEFLPIKVFCRNKRVPLVHVASALIAGDCHWQFQLGRGSGFEAVEVATATEKKSVETKLDRDLTLTEAARHLKISISSVRFLRDAGFLCSTNKLNPDTKHIKAFLTRESIQQFDLRYTTLGQMAFCLSVAPIHLARKLDDIELRPISCGGLAVRVYDRQSVAAEGFAVEASR